MCAVYDLSERCYKISGNSEKPKKLEMVLAGSNESPVNNPAFIIKNWKSGKANVLVNNKPVKDARIGINRQLEGNDLAVFFFLEKSEPVTITVTP